MGWLSALLKIKIALTLLAWVLPLFALPQGLYSELGFPDPMPLIFLRLLAMAYLALVAGYWLGLLQLNRGVYPWHPVIVGIVSNGGACAVLLLALLAGSWSDWGSLARAYMNLSALGSGLIAAGLLISALNQRSA